MDDFRKQQKLQCGDGTRNKRNPYGCDCCNEESLPKRKMTQRKLAKVRFRRESKMRILKDMLS